MLIEKERGPYFLHNNAFQTINIAVIFPYKYNDKDFMNTRLINDVINRSMHYKEKQDFKKAIITNQIIDLYPSEFYVDGTKYTRFNLIIPNPKNLKGVSVEKCIAFLADYIYNPFTENNGFEKKEVLNTIDNYKKGIEESDHLIVNYATRRLFEISAPNTVFSSTMASHKSQLDKITPQSLYSFYKQNIIKGNPFVFVMGDVDEKEITNLINKYIFKTKEKTIKINKVQNHFLEPFEFQAITEEKEFFQSFISLTYKVEDMKEKDRYTLGAIYKLLDYRSSYILMKKMRLENDLVYTTGLRGNTRYGFLSLIALINRDSKDKAIKTFEEIINLLKDENYIEPLLTKIKKEEKIMIIKDKDKKMMILNDFIDKTLGFYKGTDYDYKKLCKVTAKDVAELAGRLILDTQYFVRGMKNAK